MHIYTVIGLTIEDKKQYVVVNVTIKYYLILCCINVKADLHSTVRPGPISKHKLTVNRKTGTLFQTLISLFRRVSLIIVD